jgi:phosphoribosylamine--glycine ligase
VLPRIQSDLLETFIAIAQKKLASVDFRIDPRTTVTLMMVSGGYPGDYEKGKVIEGLERVEESIAFHAGTKWKGLDVVSNGGRVIAITSFGDSIEEAAGKSYRSAALVNYEGAYYRSDIGKDLLKYNENVG